MNGHLSIRATFRADWKLNADKLQIPLKHLQSQQGVCTHTFKVLFEVLIAFLISFSVLSEQIFVFALSHPAI